MPAGMARPDVQDLSCAALEAWCREVGEPRYRARQVLAGVHRRGIVSFAELSDVSKGLRAKLAEHFTLDRLVPDRVADARDGTRKLLFDLLGSEEMPQRRVAIESVLIPQTDRPGGARDRLTLCISTQGGCGMGCGFCATARMGLVRNLRPSEIVGQIRAAQALADRPITNLVLMGMGEPLANYEAVRTACEIITGEWGYAMSPRRVTVSTVGLAPLIAQFIAETRVHLAVSLHGTTDAQRERLVPINRRYPLAELLGACRAVPLARRKRITFEYVMLAGENDALDDARRLVSLLHGLPSKVNLIPFNPFPGTPYRPSAPAQVIRFQRALLDHGVHATVRASRGQDIQAACGQLATAQSAA
jgi:23S rRNA (adenine2503-C2)-methyltransferase